MDQRHQLHRAPLRAAQTAGLALATGLLATTGYAQTTASTTPSQPGWQQCSSLANDKDARLACFDQWAGQQATAASALQNAQTPAQKTAAAAPTTDVAPAAAAAIAGVAIAQAPTRNCKDTQFTTLSRFWELEDGTDCGTFTLRGYRPISLSVSAANGVNRLPTSDNPENNATLPREYQHGETRIQLSVRTKIAQGLLTQGEPMRKDSVWFGYTQQSYWQLFNGGISRPFRSTDHEPEVFYVYPTDAPLPWGGRWRYSGVGLVHQSNGESNPLSRSWNRWYVMTGAEWRSGWQLHLKAWKRVAENAENDDNPGIQDFVGRGEARLLWNVNDQHILGLTVRGTPGRGRGSGRLEWLRTLGEGWNGCTSNLRLLVQLFSGYGDSLLDYNYKRTALSVGLSLLDF